MTLPPFPESNYYMSPEYLKGYEEGYRDAQERVLNFLRNMPKALVEETATVSTEPSL